MEGRNRFFMTLFGNLVKYSLKSTALVLNKDPCKVVKQEPIYALRLLKTAGTYRQPPEPSMFTECFKQRSQLCSNRNFPIRLPVFDRKSYTIAGLTVLNLRLGHLITKAGFARRAIWTWSNMKAEFIRQFMPTICHGGKKHRLNYPKGKLS